jgi:predicted ATP-dependent protease
MIDPTNTVSSLELVTKIDALYSGALGHILTLVTIIVGFVGVFVPVFLYVFQNRLAKTEEAKIELRISQAVENALAQLKEDFDSYQKRNDEKMEHALARLVKFQKAEAGRSFAATLHLQANNQAVSEDYCNAAVSYLEAAGKYLLGGDYYNLIRVLIELDKKILPKLTKFDFESDRIEERFKAVTLLLEEHNEKNMFREWIDSFHTNVPVALKREPKEEVKNKN